MANNIPQLRFSEFTEKWSISNLGDVADIYDGTHQTPKYVEKGVPFVSVESIYNIENSKKFITAEAFEKDYKIKPQKNDILMTRITAGIIGATAIVKNNNPLGYYVSLALIRLKNEDVSVVFLSHYINSDYFKRELHRRIIHIAFPKKINLGEINFCKIYTSTLPEQTKIATFLTAVDERIILLQKKKAELEQYKKGIMQKLFSVKTDGNPSLRFKKEDGSDFEDWEEQSLGQIGETFNGLTGKTKVDFGKGKPYVQYMQIFSNSRIDIANFGLVDVGDDENQSKAQFGDVFFTTSSETPNEIGMSSVLTEQVEDVYLNSFCFGYRPNSLEELIPEFSQFFFRSSKVRKEIIKLAQGSTRFNMSKVAFMKLKFNFPKKDEQQKIAIFLSSIDKSIDNMTNQIDDSIVFKKGLLQKMFV
jgi:type I restriction enzyme S subunit